MTENNNRGRIDPTVWKNQQNEVTDNRLLTILSVGAITIGLACVYSAVTTEKLTQSLTVEQITKLADDAQKGSEAQLETDQKAARESKIETKKREIEAAIIYDSGQN